jgi:hypothetical protein
MSVLSSEQSQKKIGQVVLGLVKPWPGQLRTLPYTNELVKLSPEK